MKLFLALIVASSGGLFAQTVSLVAVEAPQAVTSFVLADATLQTDFLPPGMMSPDQSLSSFALSASGTAGGSMGVVWGTTPPVSSEVLVIEYRLFGSIEAQPGQVIGGVELHDLVFTLASPQPRYVDVSGALELTLPQGVSAPVLQVDLLDDGSIDWDAASPTGSRRVLVGPQPVAVRLRAGVTMQTTGGEIDLEMSFRLEVRADNDLQVSQIDAGCQPQLLCQQAFDHDGLRLRVPFGVLALAVFGLAQQPVSLPPAAGPSCLLVPTPEVAVPVDYTGLDVFLPASVRPATLFTQAVFVDLAMGGFALRTSQAFEVFAF